MKEGIEGVVPAVKENAASWLTGAGAAIVTAIVNGVKGIGKEGAGLAADLGGAMKSKLKAVGKALDDPAALPGALLGIAGAIGTKITDAITGAAEGAVGIAGDLKNAFVGQIQSAWDSAVAAVDFDMPNLNPFSGGGGGGGDDGGGGSTPSVPTQPPVSEFPSPGDLKDYLDEIEDISDNPSTGVGPAPTAATGALVEQTGALVAHEGERIGPASQVTDRGEVTVNMDEVVRELRAVRRAVGGEMDISVEVRDGPGRRYDPI